MALIAAFTHNADKGFMQAGSLDRKALHAMMPGH